MNACASPNKSMQRARTLGNDGVNVELGKLGLRGSVADAPEEAPLDVGRQREHGLVLGRQLGWRIKKVRRGGATSPHERERTDSIKGPQAGSAAQRGTSVWSGVTPTW